ncbi:MAG: LptA/OstA family protein, partial [Verrucomicrobiota bacterium]
ANDHVVIVNKKDKSHATGEQAVYTAIESGEIIELTGQPFWSDGEREGTADKFIFDRTNNLFRAEQNAVFKVPRSKIGQLDLLTPGATPSTNALSKRVVISSDLMTFKMPPTNGPIQEMIADRHVVIISEIDESRATAKRAVYQEATGLMELTGDPEWKVKGNEIKADILVAGRTNQFFGARTNVHMKLPAASFGKLASASGADTNSAGLTNQFVEVFADDFTYATNVARFRDNIRAKTEDANGSKSTLVCNFLNITFGPSNQVEKVVASDKVFLKQIIGAAAQSRVLEKSIACDLLVLNRSPQTGFVQKIHAEKNVVGEQAEREESGQLRKKISAETVDVKFFPSTNQIESIIAERNVVADRIVKTDAGEKSAQATGARASYSAAIDVVELTGKPTVTAEEVLLHEANVLRWNLKTGKISGSNTPYKVTPLNSTNRLGAIRFPKKP